MRGLGACLHAAGHTVAGPLTAGHGTTPTDLASTTWHDWIDSARRSLTELQSHSDTVVVIGLSMGSLMALALAREQPECVHGVVALSTPLVLHDRRLERYAALLRMAVPLLPTRWQFLPKGGRDIADPAARAASPAYDTMPLRSLISLVDLQRHVRSVLPEVQQPVLVMHARDDHTCPLDNVSLLRARLPSPPAVEVLDRSFHVVTVDHDRERVAERVAAFVASVAEPQQERA